MARAVKPVPMPTRSGGGKKSGGGGKKSAPPARKGAVCDHCGGPMKNGVCTVCGY